MPSLKGKNSPSTVRHRKIFTDTIAWLGKKGLRFWSIYSTPLPRFSVQFHVGCRATCENQGGDGSQFTGTEGESCNDAIHEDALEYVHMATESFGYSVVDGGKNCVMWKWDMVDAYKNIPTALPDL